VAAALPDPVRGEIVFVIDATKVAAALPDAAALDERIDALLASGATTAAIAKQLAASGAGERGALYARIGTRREGRRPPDDATA